MKLLSIDPGKSGAYAVFDHGRLIETVKIKVPSSERFLTSEVLLDVENSIWLRDYSKIVMEGLIDRNMPNQSSIATNTTAANWGMLYSTCLMSYMEPTPPTIIPPHVWKRRLGLYGKPKSASVELARKLVDPSFLRKERMRVDNYDIAEAVLIGIYYGVKELGWGYDV